MAYKAKKPSKAVPLNDTELLSLIRDREKKERLTIPQRRLYMCLVHYAVLCGLPHEDYGLKIYLTENEIAEKFGVSKSMVNKCMSLYTALGLVIRIKDEVDKRGKITVIPSEFYKKGE